MKVPALIFDCDGVLAETERDGHRRAFNELFAELSLPMRWDEESYGGLLRIGGGKERLTTLFAGDLPERAGLPSDEAERRRLVAAWHRRKTEIYVELVESGGIAPRPGVRRLALEALEAGWRLGVASTSAVVSVEAVLLRAVGADIASEFLIAAGDAVSRKKPAPDVYRLALAGLGTTAREAVAIEDSQIGLASAKAAGLACVVTISSYTAAEDFTTADLVLTHLGDDSEPMTVLAGAKVVPQGPVLHLDNLATLLSVHTTADPTPET